MGRTTQLRPLQAEKCAFCYGFRSKTHTIRKWTDALATRKWTDALATSVRLELVDAGFAGSKFEIDDVSVRDTFEVFDESA